MKNAISTSLNSSSDIKYFKRNYDMYLLLVFPILFLLLFKYLPLYGISIAFKDYNIFAGKNAFDSIRKSPWIGFDQFIRVFRKAEFIGVIMNTLIINIYKIIFLFPVPIMIAILLNEIKNIYFKRSIQTLIYMPYFLSWTIVGGIFLSILNNSGIVNSFIISLGFEKINFFMDNSIFRGVLVSTTIWRVAGWQSIIYLAAISSIDVQIYEAAIVDGASRFRQIWHVTLPGIMSTIMLMLIIRLGYLLGSSFEQILVMYNPTVYKVADVISTYVYRMGIGQMDFSLGTAVGLFHSIVSFIFIVSANSLAKKCFGKSIW